MAKMTHGEFAYAAIDAESLGYAVLHYFGRDISDEVDDYELVTLWETAYDALLRIQRKLERWQREAGTVDIGGEG